MLRYIYGDELNKFPTLRDSMFRDRTSQFKERLDWEVCVDDNGFERDAYDDLNPLYAIWETASGVHGGSMRFLPTIAQTMVNDHFTDLTDGVEIRNPLVWECTRFCLAENSEPNVSAMLMLAALEIGLNFHLSDLVGVFDARMVRIYRRLGWEPTVLGTSGTGRDAISVGLWACERKYHADLLDRAGVTGTTARQWFDRSFGAVAEPLAMAV